MKASELLDHEGNWRLHPQLQRDAVVGVLVQIGIADRILAYYSQRNNGALTIIDGHLRKDIDPDLEWPVLITDLNDDEADFLLLFLHPTGDMAKTDHARQESLLEQVVTDDLALREVMLDLERRLGEEESELDAEADEPETGGPPGMEMMPFEHYDYILVMFRNQLDWSAALELFKLEKRSNPLNRKSKKIGLARVIDGAVLLKMIQHTKAGQ